MSNAGIRAAVALTAMSALAFSFTTETDRQKKLNVTPSDSTPPPALAEPVKPVKVEEKSATALVAPAADQTTKPVKKELTGTDFNAQQDQVAIKKCLNALEVRQEARNAGKVPSNDSELCDIDLFRFLSCPYCAKVKGVLDYNDVPYKTVTADPITFSHLPQTPYSMAPQIQFIVDKTAPVGSPARGPFIVDSDLIVTALGGPLGYSSQLADPRVKETRNFISNAFSRGTFVAMYSTVKRAMESYKHCVPQHYQYLPLRVAGSNTMSFIATKKAFPKIKEHFPVSEGESIDSVVERQSNWFVDRIPSGKPFHGGDKPDIADVEMFAMTQTLLVNSQTAGIINKGLFQDWASKMAPLMQSRSKGNVGCEIPRG